MVYYRLKDLIKAVRSCKTAADERAVVQKESAAIRTSFREEDASMRYVNIAKLLYIHMLGYPSYFGQIECLKLVASPRFSDKRLGYLGIMLLLDEKQETLTLVTNSLQNDMHHSNMYTIGLALCTMGNIASAEMARDLCDEVERLLGSSNSYTRKKAALCALRVVHKVPELLDHFLDRVETMLDDKNHGVLLTAVTLITELCEQSDEALNQFRKMVPTVLRRLKSLVASGFSPEHDVSGVSDPFVQVKLLRLLRVLGRGDAEASEKMNDVLAQVATNTDGAKNVGNSILYETVLTIMEIEADHALRVLAVNILGRFLSNKDNNIRYVALNTLLKTMTMDHAAVQRHRNTVLECLHDADISIRRRALELSFALINESNVRVMVRELLAFLEVADAEFKPSMTTRICQAAGRYAPNPRWHIDTVLRVLRLAGGHVREEILAAFLCLVSQTGDLWGYTARKLYVALRSDVTQEALVLAGLWAIGEYGDYLLQTDAQDDEDTARDVSEKDVVDLIEAILAGPYATTSVREYALTAAVKLTGRFNQSLSLSRLQQLIERYRTAPELEIQQRAVEYTALIGLADIRAAVLERMPAPEVREEKVSSPDFGKKRPAKKAAPANDLMSLIGDDLGTTATPAPPASAAATMDLITNIFGETSISSPPAKSAASPAVSTPGASLLDMLGEPKPSASPASTATSVGLGIDVGGAPAPAGYTAIDKNGFRVLLEPSKDPNNPNVINVRVNFVNASVGAAVENLLLQVAVPKSQKIQFLPVSSTVVPAGQTANQIIRIANPSKTAIRLRLKLSYKNSSTQAVVEEQAEFSGFPVDMR
ncbi:Adaptor protein complex AP-1 gamma subunit [Thamnocephalis sphaerospora]|uniref:AP-1 complex subunit gamma n=1 Tax=Thamnocephalis sphaerospora TaxID=78915 RepID=A0A4V1IXD5_9FUNG|nr:Adaptor protein complex AP-1 gamma subunit [Thamnocephalis sphaerospora]|eukprot:RKP10679.1 Adaptor protein complex AP-1 gamma subunit [Thamnocephalis sphaerospora]